MPSLATYRKKRSFDRTQEPRGSVAKRAGFAFVVQKHAASRLHYDFRLELDGVLLSWAVPKGPSLDPKVKRLAMQTEDHPVDYASFEGIIPSGEYGAGTVMVWDRGRWIPEGDPRESYRRGNLKFRLEGQKLRGSWHLVRTKGGDSDGEKRSWLLFKGGDDQASATRDLTQEGKSVLSGRDLEQIAAQADRVWRSNREPEGPVRAPAAERPRARRNGKGTTGVGSDGASPRPAGAERRDPASVAGGKRAAFPTAALPCQLATLTSEAPDGDEWLHEVKLDGYRILAYVDGANVTLYTRHGLDWTGRFAVVGRALGALRLGQAVLDGEMVVLDERGRSDFQALQNSLQGAGPRGRPLIYYVFDLLYQGGWDLRGCRLDARKELLRGLLGEPAEAVIRYSDHVVGHGPAARAEACKLGLEGIVCKRRDATYHGGRARTWLKAKCAARQELVIGGYSEPAGSRTHFGALLLGVYEDGKLRYAGKTGTGFSEASLGELHRKLAPLEQARPPFVDPPRGAEARRVHWLRPELVAEISFTGFTSDGRVRQSVFQGLREDKPAAEVTREQPAPVPAAGRPEAKADADRRAASPAEDQGGPAASRKHRPGLSHPERVMYPDSGITKRQLADYYERIAPWMLPQVADRLLTLVRCPEGQHKSCFFQKHVQRGIAPGLLSVPIRENGEVADYIFLRGAEGLLGLVQMGVLEVHVWGARADAPEAPDRLVFDLDPAPDLGWADVAGAAEEVRDRLLQVGLRSFVKSTGGKGLHVVVPIDRDATRFGWEQAKTFSKAVAQAMEADAPGRYLSIATKEKRKGKIYVDYLRNARGATSIAAYSTRARPGAPLSVPLGWDEIRRFDPAAPYTLAKVESRLARRDPWEGLGEIRQSLPDEVLRRL